jgi:flagellin-like protein
MVKNMTFAKKTEEAVSPVIGVILMVAITVILAAVIAAFVFGMAGNIQRTHIVSLTAQRNSSAFVIVTDEGGQDANTLIAMDWQLNGQNVTQANVGFSSGVTGDGKSGAVPNTGYSSIPVGAYVAIPSTNVGKDNLIVTGIFKDGSTQILTQLTI